MKNINMKILIICSKAFYKYIAPIKEKSGGKVWENMQL
jgi:hypothetical protein